MVSLTKLSKSIGSSHLTRKTDENRRQVTFNCAFPLACFHVPFWCVFTCGRFSDVFTCLHVWCVVFHWFSCAFMCGVFFCCFHVWACAVCVLQWFCCVFMRGGFFCCFHMCSCVVCVFQWLSCVFVCGVFFCCFHVRSCVVCCFSMIVLSVHVWCVLLLFSRVARQYGIKIQRCVEKWSHYLTFATWVVL